jgi:hypothetical protein
MATMAHFSSSPQKLIRSRCVNPMTKVNVYGPINQLDSPSEPHPRLRVLLIPLRCCKRVRSNKIQWIQLMNLVQVLQVLLPITLRCCKSKWPKWMCMEQLNKQKNEFVVLPLISTYWSSHSRWLHLLLYWTWQFFGMWGGGGPITHIPNLTHPNTPPQPPLGN